MYRNYFYNSYYKVAAVSLISHINSTKIKFYLITSVTEALLKSLSDRDWFVRKINRV